MDFESSRNVPVVRLQKQEDGGEWPISEGPPSRTNRGKGGATATRIVLKNVLGTADIVRGGDPRILIFSYDSLVPLRSRGRACLKLTS